MQDTEKYKNGYISEEVFCGNIVGSVDYLFSVHSGRCIGVEQR